jgi:RNA polymerase sigma-70 factor, ECF subfamily
VFIKLSKSPTFARTSPEKLTAYAVHAMRQVLIDGARKLRAKKRGAQPKRVTLDESTLDTTFGTSTNRADDLLALDQALDALAGQHADGSRMVKVVELRFFGGFGWAEIAKTLGVSASTVRRDWDFARPWLHAKLRKLS